MIITLFLSIFIIISVLHGISTALAIFGIAAGAVVFSGVAAYLIID